MNGTTNGISNGKTNGATNGTSSIIEPLQPHGKHIPRRQCIPILYTKGTHYDVGFDVGRTFAAIIKSFLELSDSLNNEYLPIYKTTEGKAVYDATLASVRSSFPQYIRELEGVAQGAGVEFHKLFLLHMDDITPNATNRSNGIHPPVGCSSICVNQPDHEILAHTEDALEEVLNHFYIVSAHIIEATPQGKHKVTEERFTSLCYAGHLPGYTMGYNHHGLVYSINTLSAATLHSGKTPRHFITRALLSAPNFEQAQKILRDTGVGAADGCSVNMTFLKQEGDRLFHNIEMGPVAPGENQSQLNVFTASPGECIIHANKYLRLPINEVSGMIIESSNARHEAFDRLGKPKTKEDAVKMLGDQSGESHPVFRDSAEIVKTVAVGIFDCKKQTWSLYSDNPKFNEPLVVLPLVLKS